MSVPCLEATKEEQDAAVSEEDAMKSESKETESNKETQNERKRRFPDPEPSKRSKPKLDGQEDVHAFDEPSDLSTGTSKEEEYESHSVIVAKHYNTIENKSLAHRNNSRILYMRNFNNWIKSMQIGEYTNKLRQKHTHGSSFKVLDLCCGKGGDIPKWTLSNVTHVIFSDIAELSVEQCKKRYESRTSNNRRQVSAFTAQFITADCTKVRLREKFKDPSVQLDLVSCQFAFHYSFESLQQAECMLRNVSESLRPGGYFIGTIPDAYDLVSRWQKSDGNTFGNEVYSIEFLCDKTKPPLFGAKYNFFLEGVVNCPEFLVHLPTFTKLALKFGLELEMFERFDSYYERMKRDGLSTLNRMQGLETYPPHHNVALLGNPTKDYKHAMKFVKNIPSRHKIGTLSQAEWEAISIYAVFAFRKMKTTWNREGKPEYVKQ